MNFEVSKNHTARGCQNRRFRRHFPVLLVVPARGSRRFSQLAVAVSLKSPLSFNFEQSIFSIFSTHNFVIYQSIHLSFHSILIIHRTGPFLEKGGCHMEIV